MNFFDCNNNKIYTRNYNVKQCRPGYKSYGINKCEKINYIKLNNLYNYIENEEYYHTNKIKYYTNYNY